MKKILTLALCLFFLLAPANAFAANTSGCHRKNFVKFYLSDFKNYFANHSEKENSDSDNSQSESAGSEALGENETLTIGEFESEVIRLTNIERKNNGLKELTVNESLCALAEKKSKDMYENNYFSHTSPTYGSPFEMMKANNISYKSAGENIAKGQRTPKAVVDAWMNSEGHRKNILNKSFTQIGVGYYENCWSQMFIGN